MDNPNAIQFPFTASIFLTDGRGSTVTDDVTIVDIGYVSVVRSQASESLFSLLPNSLLSVGFSLLDSPILAPTTGFSQLFTTLAFPTSRSATTSPPPSTSPTDALIATETITRTPTDSAATETDPVEQGGQGGMASGARIGIGVGVGVGTLLLVAIVVLSILLARSRKKARTSVIDSQPGIEIASHKPGTEVMHQALEKAN